MPAIETARRMIDATDCDILGHRNVNHYFVMCSDGGFGLQDAFGLGRRHDGPEISASFAVVHAESDFLKEVLAGEIIYQHSSVTSIGTKSATFLHRQFRTSDNALVFQSSFKAVLLDLKARRGMPIPDEVKSRMQEFMETPG